jgi:hypothetical protein
LAARKARLVIQSGTDRPEVRNSELDETVFFSFQPMPKTKRK